MKTYLLIILSVLFCSSCKKDEHYDRVTISISNKSEVKLDSVYVYSVVRNIISDSLIIKNVLQSKDTVVVWDNIITANEDAGFDFKVFLSNKKELKGYGGERDDLPYSKIPLKMSLTVYSDSINIVSE